MTEKMKVNSLKAWLLGIRPTSLGGSLVTVLIGSGLAHGYAPEKFSWTVAVLCLLFAWFVHVAANLINDVVDFERGLDKSDPDRIDQRLPHKARHVCGHRRVPGDRMPRGPHHIVDGARQADMGRLGDTRHGCGDSGLHIPLQCVLRLSRSG